LYGRSYNNAAYNGTSGYRYGFNAKELDKSGEWGSLTQYDYGFRIYNPSIGKFLSVDPLTKEYPWYTPYQFAGNTPIQASDLDGLEPDYSGGKENEVVLATDKESGFITPYTWGGTESGWLPNMLKEVLVSPSLKDKIGDFFEAINPVEDLEFYGSATIKYTADLKDAYKNEIKKNLPVPSFVKKFGHITAVIPQGYQFSLSSKNGSEHSVVNGSNSYLNAKFKNNAGSLDLRFQAFQGLSKISDKRANSDFNPAFRVHVTPKALERSFIKLSNDESVLNAKLQIEGQMSLDGDFSGGIRANVETMRIMSYSAEASFGVRLHFKIPELFKDK
jgi:RHS repeat-associated protein